MGKADARQIANAAMLAQKHFINRLNLWFLLVTICPGYEAE
jgi:hypothetical protein